MGFFAIKKILNNVPVLLDIHPSVVLNDNGDEIEESSILFMILNPNRAARIKGVYYGYTLFEMASDVLIMKEEVQQYRGLNSLSQTRSPTGFQCAADTNTLLGVVKDFFSRSVGSNVILDPVVSSRVLDMQTGLASFTAWLTQPEVDLASVAGSNSKFSVVERTFWNEASGGLFN